ncbi:MAG TPA: enoyl-CoA hydratase-related protein [Phototrophicaceae bacterium]|nr:enoyl-CoA hydratase-related protein [Phototrophicaceae bacterium]
MGYITTEKKSNTLIIKINRPDVLNAINYDLVTEFKNTMDLVFYDEDIYSVIITGQGEKSFSAGGDLNYVVRMSPSEAIDYANHVHGLLNKIENLDKPVIAAINGFALGGGCQISLACDLRIASSNAKIGQTEVKIGISPGWGATQRLSRIVGISKAKEMIFTGRIVTADEAYSMKLVDKVIYLNDCYNSQEPTNKNTEPNEVNLKEKLISECIVIAETINGNNITALKVSKTLINKARDCNIQTGLFLEQLGYRFCLGNTKIKH